MNMAMVVVRSVDWNIVMQLRGGVGRSRSSRHTPRGILVLGPSDLYKLVKEIGKFVQNARTLGAEAAKSFEGTMKDQF